MLQLSDSEAPSGSRHIVIMDSLYVSGLPGYPVPGSIARTSGTWSDAKVLGSVDPQDRSDVQGQRSDSQKI